MRYVVIDIETGGLDHNTNAVLEVGAVVNVLGEKEHPPATFEAIIVYPDNQYSCITPYCAKLHQRIWDKLLARPEGKPTMEWMNNGGVQWGDYKGFCYAHDLAAYFLEFLTVLGFPREADGRIKINVGGKNYSGFDARFLETWCNFSERIITRHRVIDIATHFWQPGDKTLPDLATCLKRAGFAKQVEHGALADAKDVDLLIQTTLWEPFKLDLDIEERRR